MQVAFRLDFEFSKSIFMHHLEIQLAAGSDSDEEESTKEDNTVLLRFHLKYEADILFTRWARAPGEGRCGRSDAYDEAPSGGT